jgi:hypothetical protein
LCEGIGTCIEQYCRDTYDLIDTDECPDCPATGQNAVQTFCQNAVNNAFCSQMCTSLNLCPAAGTGALPVDLNDDGIVGNDEIFIIKLALFAKDSEPQANCGAEGEQFCHFQDQGYYVCENLEFIQVITGSEAPAAGQTCGGLEYITGGTS